MSQFTYPTKPPISAGAATPAKPKPGFTPTRWDVTASATDLSTGRPVVIARHDCRSWLHASNLVAMLRLVAADLEAEGLLTGITATGYELAEETA